MTDTPTTFSEPSSVPNNFSDGQTKENIVDKEPPPYTFLNPTVSNTTHIQYPNVVQYQPQLGAVEYAASMPGLYAGPVTVNPQATEIESYKVWSILNILFCCLIFGFVACFYSNETENSALRGDVQGALNASRNARTWNIIATVFGMIVTPIYILHLAEVL